MPTADDVKRAVLGRGAGRYAFCNSNPANFVDPDGAAATAARGASAAPPGPPSAPPSPYPAPGVAIPNLLQEAERMQGWIDELPAGGPSGTAYRRQAAQDAVAEMTRLINSISGTSSPNVAMKYAADKVRQLANQYLAATAAAPAPAAAPGPAPATTTPPALPQLPAVIIVWVTNERVTNEQGTSTVTGYSQGSVRYNDDGADNGRSAGAYSGEATFRVTFCFQGGRTMSGTVRFEATDSAFHVDTGAAIGAVKGALRARAQRVPKWTINP